MTMLYYNTISILLQARNRGKSTNIRSYLYISFCENKKSEPRSILNSPDFPSRLHLTAHHPRHLFPPQLRHTMPELFKAYVLAPAVEDVVDQTGSQPAQTQGRSDDRFVEPDGLGQFSDVAELALIDVRLPAESTSKRDDDRRFVHLAGIHDLVARPDASKLDGDADLQVSMFKKLYYLFKLRLRENQHNVT